MFYVWGLDSTVTNDQELSHLATKHNEHSDDVTVKFSLSYLDFEDRR